MSLIDAVIFCTVISQMYFGGILGQMCGNKTVLITVSDGAGTKNPHKYDVLKTNDKLKLERSNFDKNLPTLLLFPGWLGKDVDMMKVSSVLNISAAALEQTKTNVIIVDWNIMSEDLILILFREHVLPIAEHCKKFLSFLINEGMKPEETHIVAFSLGVHIVAMVLEDFRHKVGRFTALDPLGIVICDDIFERGVLNERIGRSLAGFVDVIHTSKFGTNLPSGHVDFYVDGGTEQHRCGPDPYENAICSHQSACTYYADSIYHPQKYEGINCASYGKMLKAACNGPLEVMGYKTPTYVRGIYYVPVDKFLVPESEPDKNIATISKKPQLLLVPILCVVFH